MSEGSAGQFVGRPFDAPPEPWECAVTDDIPAHDVIKAARGRTPSNL